MSRSMGAFWKSCLGAALLALSVPGAKAATAPAGTASAGAPAKSPVKPDSSVVAARKAAAEASGAAHTARMSEAEEAKKLRAANLEARLKAKQERKKAVPKDVEIIRKSDEARDEARVKEMKEEIAAKSKARKAVKQRYERESVSVPLSNRTSTSETSRMPGAAP